MTLPPADSAVFTGAGISGEEPAALPRGFELRDRILAFMHANARRAAGPVVTDAQLLELTSSGRKLEIVLGRLWGIIGNDALRCLLALHLDVPNRAHMLAALHLMRGGTHVTLNFDVGIEFAYDLLTCRRPLPPPARPFFEAPLQDWRLWVPPRPAGLHVVASHQQFDAWAASPRPALLKIHGSLTLDQDDLVDVVVVDNEELAALRDSRLAALRYLAGTSELVVTGYSGADPDVYRPLLQAAPRPTRWCCYSLDPASPVPADLAAAGIELRLGAPEGLAETALEQLLGPVLPAWPQTRLAGDHFDERFAVWSQLCARCHDPNRFALAWAWLLADLGDHDGAASIMAELFARKHSDPLLAIRYAEVLYTRAAADDRQRAGQMFREIARDPSVELGLRLQSRLRLADISRGRAVRTGGRAALGAALAKGVVTAARVILETRNGRTEPEMTADAYRLMQHTTMRTIERAAAGLATRYWPALAPTCRLARKAGERAEQLSTNGNRRIMLRQRSCHLQALAALLRHRRASRAVIATLQELHDAYWNADDRNGAANCTVSLALAVASGDGAQARSLLRRAEREYRQATASGEPIPSGEALLQVALALVSRAP